jgi:ribosomal protein L11 methylase PrmA
VTIIGRAITEPAFRDALFADAEGALAGCDLSVEEREFLRALAPEQLYAWVGRMVAHKLLPVRVGRRLLIVPAGIEPSPEPGDLIVRLDQRRNDAWVTREGLPVAPDGSAIPPDGAVAFGSGLHPTTRLCLGALEQRVRPGERILDVGTGSGVLAVAAARLGASAVLALDVDASAIRVAREHVALNGVEQVVRVERGSLERALPGDGDAAGFVAHVVVANVITAVVVRMLGDGLPETLRPGGTLIVSGIRAEEAVEVVGAVERAGLEVVELVRLEKWVAVVSRPAGLWENENESC